MVLLNDAFTCTTPEVMFLRSLRRGRAGSFAIFVLFPSVSLLLLSGDRARRAFTGAGIGMGPLATHRQAFAMTKPAVGAQIHQPLDVHRDLAPKVALDHVFAIDHLTDLQNL